MSITDDINDIKKVLDGDRPRIISEIEAPLIRLLDYVEVGGAVFNPTEPKALRSFTVFATIQASMKADTLENLMILAESKIDTLLEDSNWEFEEFFVQET